MRVRRLQHVSLPYPDGEQETVRAFYGALVGLREIDVPQTLQSQRLIWFSGGPDNLELHFFPGVPDGTHRRHLCLEVDDADTARRELKGAGHAPFDATPIPGRPRFFCRDPFGNLVEFTVLEPG